MSPFLTALIAGGSILIVILATDLGRRRVTRPRLIRSVIAVFVILGLCVHSLPLGGNDPSLQLLGIGTGVICGLVAAALMPVEWDASGAAHTVAGFGYAALWAALSAARVLFAYGSEHWFNDGMIRFSMEYEISGADAYSNAFVFMALAMALTRTAAIVARCRGRNGARQWSA
ncbi:hypothetical protein [Streptomyces sp. URMC 123]|uniref:hypothetical protein n=1 Tax=Streptomyces sp. URMC 123 TaxID=3423403 RepID=UPI003F1C14E9